MGLFTRNPIYNHFTLSGGSGGVDIFAHFTSAARKGNGLRDTARNATFPAPVILEQVRSGSLHPDDRALFMLALESMAALAENNRLAAEFESTVARRTADEKRIANLLTRDIYDLRAPDKPFRRHIHRQHEPARHYKGYSLITSDPDNIRAALKLAKPDMYHSTDGKAYHPRFTMDMTEHRLLYEHNNNGHLNYDDQLMVHEALLELRAYKIRNGLPVIPLRPEYTPPPPERPLLRRHGRMIYY